MKGLKKIFTNINILVLLVVNFILGCCWGFVETFLFVYLKDDLKAPMYLLGDSENKRSLLHSICLTYASLSGLTITVGAVVSIPFLIWSDWIVLKVQVNSLPFMNY